MLTPNRRCSSLLPWISWSRAQARNCGKRGRSHQCFQFHFPLVFEYFLGFSLPNFSLVSSIYSCSDYFCYFSLFDRFWLGYWAADAWCVIEAWHEGFDSVLVSPRELHAGIGSCIEAESLLDKVFGRILLPLPFTEDARNTKCCCPGGGGWCWENYSDDNASARSNSL